MNRQLSPFESSAVTRWLFAAGLVAIPFDAVRGIGALGELGNELSFPFFAAAIASAALVSLRMGRTAIGASLVLRAAAVAMAIVFASYLANIADIHGIVFRERTGFNKFATSLLVLLYGFALAWLAEQVREEEWRPLVARFIGWSAIAAILYLLIEIPGRAGLLGGVYESVDSLVHSRQADVINAWNGAVNEKVLYGWDDRLRSVSFEPPAFGNYTGFAWPWLWYAAVKAPPERKLRHWALLVVFTLVIVFAASRTALLMLTANLCGLALLGWVYTRPGRNNEALAAARILLPVVAILIIGVAVAYLAGSYGEIVGRLTAGDSVSNISRVAFQLAGLNIFLAHPLVGVGLGQFAFHVAGALPSWAYQSPEVMPMITYPAAPWPTVYSLYARLAAELGLAGLIGWIALWTGMAALLARRARAEREATGEAITLHFPVILNCIDVLLSGIASDTFRTPMIWIALGLGCALLVRSRAVGSIEARGAAAPA